MPDVTGDRLRELRWAEERLHLVAENVDEVILVAAADLSSVEYVTPAYEELYGQPVERLYERPRSFLESVHPDDRGAYEADVESMLADFERDDPESVYEGEYRLRGADGEGPRWVRVSRYPVLEDGTVERFVAVVEEVTERRELERAYRDVFENVSDGLVVHDPETGEILDANDRYCELTRYDHDELVGADVGLITATDPAYPEERAREKVQKAREEGPQLFEWKGQRADGSTFLGEVHLSVVSVGGEERVLASVRDVTERREIERAYRQVFESVGDGLVVHDPETGEILDVNERFREMNGYDADELVGETVDVVTSVGEGYSYEEANRHIRRAREAGPQLFEWRNERKDGTTFPVEVHLAIVEIRGEERVLASVRDVTERKRREHEYEQIFNTVNDAISVHDPETGEILEVNDTYVEEFGYDESAILELGVEGLSVPEEGYTEERSREIIREVAETGDSTTVEWLVETAGGDRRWYGVSVTPARIGGERRVLGISRDVTERKRRERVVRSLHESTERLQDAGTREAVCEATVEAATAVLDLSMPACWLHEDGEEPALEPVAAAEPAWSAPGGPGTFEPGSVGYGAYERGEVEIYDPSERRERTPLEHGLLVPLGEHGLLGAADPGVDDFDEITLDAARILARHATTALDRVERGRELRESERRLRLIADRIDEVIFLSTPDFSELFYVNDAYEEIWGEPVEALFEDPMGFVDRIDPRDRETFEAAFERMLAEINRGDAEDSYVFEYRVRRPDETVRWVRATGYPVERDDGTGHDGDARFVGIVEDVTEQREREQTLETFHDATRELVSGGSRREASETAVAAAERVLGFPLVSVHLYDDQEGSLQPAAATDALDRVFDSLPSFGPGGNVPWQVFVDGEAVRPAETDSDTGIYARGVSDPDLVLPLGPHGVMLVGAPEQEFDPETVELAQILAATLEAALNHVEGRRELERRETELEEHRERADRLERLNTVIREIEQATVEESSREAVERAVCAQLTTVEPYRAAWVAEPDVAGDALVTRTSDGDGSGYAEALVVDLGNGVGAHPSATAFETGEIRRVQSLATSATRGEWRKAALRAGYQSMIAVPLVGEGSVHGVLTIVGDDPGAFEAETEDVLAELGRSVGHAISVLERRAALESDTTTELEFAVEDERLSFVRLAAETGAEVELERAVRRPEGVFGAFYTVEGAEPGRVVDRAETAPDVRRAHVVSEDDGACLVEVRTTSWFGTVFAEYGAVVRTAVAEGEGGRLVVEAPRAADVRTVVESFRERYPDAELVAQRTRERAVQSLLELQDLLGDQLTPRQLEALETAYSAGYFDWPRESSGEEVAELLGVTQPTFNKHLRTAERKAFSMLLNREYPE
jgi:PAS domain S-box-containing protein